MEKTYNSDPAHIEDVVCGNWWSAHSRSVEITDYPVTLTFNNITKAGTDKNWYAPASVIFSSADGKVGAEASDDSPNHYREYAVIRSDAYAWKTAALHCKYERQHTPSWTNWDSWRKRNQEGCTYLVTAVRYGSYLYVRSENPDLVICATITLPMDIPEHIYLSMTGEQCSITDFRIEREVEPIGPGTIDPVSYSTDFIPVTQGDIPNVDCPGWWIGHSDGIEIKEQPVHVSFHTISYPNAKETWHTPFTVLYSALDQLVNGIAYHEFSITRHDGYGWKSEATGFATKTICAEGFSDWNKWLAQNKVGRECSLTAYRKQDMIILEQKNGDVTAVSHTLLPFTDLPIYLSLSGELCAITNIRFFYDE